MRRSFSSFVIVLAVFSVAAGTFVVAAPKKREMRGVETTVRGRLVDVHSYMTRRSSGEDSVRATQDSFRAGAAAAIETAEGLVVLGSGDKGPSRMIVPLARQQVAVKGKLYERAGLRYIDMTSIESLHGESEAASTKDEGQEAVGEEPTDGAERAVEPPAQEPPLQDEPASDDGSSNDEPEEP